jgi:uncharacterized UBP type Zn finger protein
MDYISQLCTEGFPQSRVIRALGITRNDLSMSRDILQEFALPSIKSNTTNATTTTTTTTTTSTNNNTISSTK